jgi:hypothetical protein
MEVAEATLAKEREQVIQAERVQAETDQVVNAAVVGPRALVRQLLKRQVVNRHWGEGQVSGVCWGGCSKNMVYDEVHLAHWRPRSELSEKRTDSWVRPHR